MKKREFMIIGILSVLFAWMEMTGFPSSLFIHIEVLDITPFYWTLMLNFILIGVIAFFALHYLCPRWKLGLHAHGLMEGLKKYGIAGIVVAIVSGIAFYIGLQPLDVEELYVRGLLLHLIESLFAKNKNHTMIAIIASSVIFGLGHVFGVLGQSLFVILTKVIWTIAMGIYFGVIYKKTDNLWLPIILHFIIDVCALPYCFTTIQGYSSISLFIILPMYILLGIYSLSIMKREG